MSIQTQESNPRHFLLYNETTYLPQLYNAVNEGKLIFQLSDLSPIKPYLGLAMGQDLRSDDQVIYNDNHVTPLAGIRYAPRDLPLGLYLEFRQNLRVIRPPTIRDFSQGDLRLGAYIYQWFDLTPNHSFSRLFQEIYGEMLFTSALQNNLIAQGWLKQGVRGKIHQQVNLDSYLEFAGTADRTGNPDFNLLYVDLGIRANLRVNSILTQLIVKKPLAWFAGPPSLAFPWSAQLVFSGEF